MPRSMRAGRSPRRCLRLPAALPPQRKPSSKPRSRSIRTSSSPVRARPFRERALCRSRLFAAAVQFPIASVCPKPYSYLPNTGHLPVAHRSRRSSNVCGSAYRKRKPWSRRIRSPRLGQSPTPVPMSCNWTRLRPSTSLRCGATARLVRRDPSLRRREGSMPCARLRPRQFPAQAGDAEADQGLVADKSEGRYVIFQVARSPSHGKCSRRFCG